jgi:hypothetical protein
MDRIGFSGNDSLFITCPDVNSISRYFIQKSDQALIEAKLSSPENLQEKD